MTAEQVRQWVVENRVRPETMAKPEGDQQWKSVSAWPAFSDLWATPTESADRQSPIAIQGTTEEELRLFVGPNADYYLLKWRVLALSGGKLSWNWAACIWGPSWTAYRKMYSYTWLIFVILTAECIIEVGLNLSALFGLGMTILIWVAWGVFGNYLYLTHARRKVVEIKLTNRDLQLHQVLLANAGGTSWGSAIGLSLLLGLLWAGIFIGISILVAANGGIMAGCRADR